MTVVLGVSVSLAIRTLCYGAFWFRRFESDSALLKVFHLEDVFVVGGRLKVDEKHGEGELSTVMRDVPDISDLMAELFDF
jgi:hypothetical protein